MTSVPDYQPPEQTRPFMIASTADPPTWEILSLEHEALSGNYPPVNFSVQVVSEDIGVDVEALFYLVPHTLPEVPPPEDPGGVPGGKIEAGSLDDVDARVLRKTWRAPVGAEGCATLFWVAAHRFDSQTGCPAPAADPATGDPISPPRDDSSRLSWTVVLCKDETECAAARLPDCVALDPKFTCDLDADEGGS